MASTSASAQRHRWTYDVFVSFRGEDIRKSFMDHLFKDFRQKGIHAFRDDNQFPRGEEISTQLYKAIEESRFLIVIFSRNYASSSWCLRELAKIMECKQTEEHKHEVQIIFYDVKPNVVRKQTESYAEAFLKHEISNRAEVAKWKEALTIASNLSGWDLEGQANGYESKLIDSISKEILVKLCNGPLHVGENLVALDAHIEKMDLLQFVHSSKVHMMGICGIGGIGKTTFAKAIYNLMYIHFEECSFLDDVQGATKRHGLTHVVMQLINNIMKTTDVTISNMAQAIMVMKQRIAARRILLVLDDVDHHDQLETLAGSSNWFFPGSLIIFTSKDKQLLRSHRVDDIYDMPVLPGDKALELFSLYAFGKKHPTKAFIEVSNKVVDCLQGHPLALRVLGGCLYEKPLHVWQSEVDKLQTYPKEDIQQKLRPSFDRLDFNEKRILLDIACSLLGENKDIVASVLGNGNSLAYADMEVLVNKSLITISGDDNSLQMHELIRSMARRIIHEEFVVKNVWSRLWNLSEAGNELRKKKAIEAVEVLDLLLEESSQNIHIDGDAFEDMKNLRILKISQVDLEKVTYPFALELMDSKVTYFGRLKSLSNKLRLLYWHGCPFEFPSDFYPETIVAIDLSYSHLKTLWTTPKCFGRLKTMKLRHCRNLTSTPDFTRITNLEELILEGCVNLVKVHPSIGMLKKLVVLNMRDCKRFRRFPCKVEMDSLEILHLSGCSKLDKLPEFFCINQTLKEFYVSKTSIMELPSFVYSQRNLQVLEFGRLEDKRSRWWTSIPQPSWLPSKIQHPQSLVIDSLAGLCSLTTLNLSHCNMLEVSDSIGGLSCLKSLDLSGNNFTSLPRRLSQLSRLKFLRLSGCKKLEVLLELPPDLGCLHAFDCTSLYQLPPNRKFSKPLFMWFDGCTKLFRNVSIESQFCPSQPQPDLNSSITSHSCRNEISSFLQSMEFPNNTHGIFGGQEGKFFHQELSIKYHANIIPQWFTYTSTRNRIEVKLPSNNCYNKLRGHAICVVFTPKNSYDREFSLSGLGYFMESVNRRVPYGFFYYSIKTHKKDLMLFHFVARPELVELENCVSFFFHDTPSVEVKECGVRLVFDEDIQGEETSFSIIDDLPAPTQEGGVIDICKNAQSLHWSW